MIIAAKRMFAVNKEAADNQVSLIVEAWETLMASKGRLEAMANGQTAKVWTSDGKSVDLANALTLKYGAAVQWVSEIQRTLKEAAVNLEAAIRETDQLDDQQRGDHLKRLEKILAPDSIEA